jgi:peptidoglycan/LPS O-acetylase OafA/YrhL
VVVVSLGLLCRSGLYVIALQRTTMALSFAGLIWIGAATGTVFTRLLEAPLLAWLGQLSYSLYLWQQPFLNPHDGSGLSSWPLNLGLTVACAVTSYLLIEQPAQRWRARRHWGKVT